MKRLEYVTAKSFEPLEGITVLCAAKHDTPQDCHAFILNKPMCQIKRHQVLSLTEKAQVKITENLEVVSEFYNRAEKSGAGKDAVGNIARGFSGSHLEKE